MAARIPEAKALLIDLSAPFGWSGSPPFYSAFGRAITWLVQQNSPHTVLAGEDNEAFWGFEWVDDHLLIEVDMEDRLQLAEATLRHAMLAIHGPRAINEEKFSQWKTRLNALGLTWDTANRTVSMPVDTIAKALDRVRKLKQSKTVTKSDLLKISREFTPHL
ncbi:unnamed protein product [Phytophthora fragariaefolia]|uniref:Unnamed protein product n=1 Tax=Phytophthora fragariaefolia TaxID=1490495 RepID=A0A9W7CKU1_9STRA|nr:unnamed protein product [Phytophthora fragariaefolia]